MDFLETIREKAKKKKKTIILPEGSEKVICSAAQKIADDGIANIILLGDEKTINAGGKNIKILDPSRSNRKKEFAEEYFELRKNKETPAAAGKAMDNPLYFGCMLVRRGEADGLVGGALNTTADTVRAAIKVIGTGKNGSLVSSFFIMRVPDSPYGEKGHFLFADCGVVPDPTAEHLAAIALATAENADKLFGWTPRVAMLSFSTKGSAKSESAEKVKSAVEMARKENPALLIDGELQLDAAIVSEVAKKKGADRVLSGNANVLIFPDLNSGNIGYKLVQRLARADAVGPILQGLQKPVNDLSRGCSMEDVLNAVAVTAVQAG